MSGGAPARRRGEEAARIHEVATPEGIPIRFELARAGDRAGAFLLDLLILVAAIAGVLLLASLAAGYGRALSAAIAILAAFLLLNFYFVWFELRWRGTTPGKRLLGLRVIDARGGPLDGGAVLARNLVRELEVWTPLRLVLGAEVVWPGAPGWALLLSGAWALGFLLLPLANRDRLRAGDLIAGTCVVVQPRVALLPELLPEGAAAHAFTEAQLGVYGVYELQVLEDLLRRPAGAAATVEAIAAVAEQIRTRIGYDGRIEDGERFLRDFYAAQRRHLEQRLRSGQRREDKHGS